MTCLLELGRGREANAGHASPVKELKTKADDPMNALEDPATKEKYTLVRSVGEECVADGELAILLSRKPDSFILYDGFEPSGRMHIAQGVFKAMNVNKCTRAGGTFVFWVADWFALMNDKMGGDLEKIKTVGKYLVEVCHTIQRFPCSSTFAGKRNVADGVTECSNAVSIVTGVEGDRDGYESS